MECRRFPLRLHLPFASQNQAKAMFAAASGNSNIGIPAKVGKEFVKASVGMKVGTLPKFKKPKPAGMPSAQPFGSLSPAGPAPSAPMDGDS